MHVEAKVAPNMLLLPLKRSSGDLIWSTDYTSLWFHAFSSTQPLRWLDLLFKDIYPIYVIEDFNVIRTLTGSDSNNYSGIKQRQLYRTLCQVFKCFDSLRHIYTAPSNDFSAGLESDRTPVFTTTNASSRNTCGITHAYIYACMQANPKSNSWC